MRGVRCQALPLVGILLVGLLLVPVGAFPNPLPAPPRSLAGSSGSTASALSRSGHERRATGPTALVAPLATLHYTPGSNFNGSTYAPGPIGFNLADVSTASELSSLPSGVKGLVWLGDTSGNTSAFRAQLAAFLPLPANVFGFYVADEPIPSSVPAANLAAEVAYIHRTFPGVFCFVVLYNTGSDQHPGLGGYTAENTGLDTPMDLVGLDPYPFQTQFPGGVDLGIINARLNVTLAGGWVRSQLVPVYQAFGNYGGDDYTVPTVAQLEEDLARWAPLTPTPVFDYAYAWGGQAGDTPLSKLPDLQAVFRQLFTSFRVSFIESGLPAGTTWSVEVDAARTSSSAPSPVSVLLENGTYLFAVGNVMGYSATPGNGNLTVNGSEISRPIGFASLSRATYRVTFTESGLASGAAWSIVLGNATANVTSTTLSFEEPNGSYPFRVGSVAGYSAEPSFGQLEVNGTPTGRTILFAPLASATYSVTFREAGLPAATRWSVAIGNSSEYSSGTEISFTEPNGSYTFSVGPVPGDSSSPSGGNLAVNGTSLNETIVFSPLPTARYSLQFVESGLPAGTNWSVVVEGESESSTGSSISFSEPNGTYSFGVGVTMGYAPNATSGSVTVQGAAIRVSIGFASLNGTLTFIESGLPTGTVWSVTVDGRSLNATGSLIEFPEPNGKYSYIVPSIPGYSSNRTAGTVEVNGNDTVVLLRFAPTSGGALILGLPSAQGYALVAGIAVLAAGALTALVTYAWRRRSSRAVRVPARPPSAPPRSTGP